MRKDATLAQEHAPLADLELCFRWMKEIPERQRTPSADVIIALGNAAAIRTAGLAAHLFYQRVAPVILCCGGHGRGTEQARTTEAELMAKILRSCGVPHERILTEECAANTFENFAMGFALLDRAGIPRKRIVIVHDNGALRRDRNLLHNGFPEYARGGTHYAAHCGWGERFVDVALCGAFGSTIATYASLFVGTLQRTIECVRAPYQWHLPDEPPADIRAAYQQLIIHYPEQLLNLREGDQ